MLPRKLKILFIVLEMDTGGLQRMVNLLIQRIDKDRFEPYICCLDRRGVFFVTAQSNCAGTFVLERRPGVFDWRLFVKLCRIIKDNNIDIIHSHNGCSFYAALSGCLARVRGIIHTDHGRLVPDKKGAILEDRISSYMMDYIVCVSEALSKYMAATVKIARSKLLTIINGVDISTFIPVSLNKKRDLRISLGFSDNDKIIGTVCRLDPIKNLSFLIDCIPTIKYKIPNVKIVIVGDGECRNSLMSQVQMRGLNNTIKFLGQREDIESILPSFDVYACTSLSEGTSMTILEAMACGLPIIASGVGGNVELVDDTNGIVFPLNNSDAFVEGVISLLLHKDVRLDKGKKSRRRIEDKYSLNQTVNKYEQLYISLSNSRL